MRFFLKSKNFLIGIIVFLFIVIANTCFVNSEDELSIILQFGQAKSYIDKPGFYVKIPFLQFIKKYSKKSRLVLVSEKELTCSDGKRVVVNAISYLKIVDPIKFYSSLNSEFVADIRTKNIIESCMREVIGRYSLSNLLSGDRSSMMNQICLSSDQSINKYGIQIVDVRISKADLPDENRGAICRRMQTSREQEAKKIRAEGAAESTNIFAEADKTKKIILAEAYKKSQQIKAEGEQISAKVYNQCYSQDVEFFKFFKSLEGYKKIFGNGQTEFVLPLSSKFFEYLNLGK